MTDQPTKEQLEAILDTVFECGWEAGERYKEAKGGTTDVSDTLFKAKQDITALIQEARVDEAKLTLEYMLNQAVIIGRERYVEAKEIEQALKDLDDKLERGQK